MGRRGGSGRPACFRAAKAAWWLCPIVGDFLTKVYADPRLGISKEDRFPRPASMPRYDCSENADGTDQSPDGISDDDEFFD